MILGTLAFINITLSCKGIEDLEFRVSGFGFRVTGGYRRVHGGMEGYIRSYRRVFSLGAQIL